MKLRFFADRLSPETAWRATHLRMRIVPLLGIGVYDTGEGCPLWYWTPDYDRAFTETVEDLTRQALLADVEPFRVTGDLHGMVEPS